MAVLDRSDGEAGTTGAPVRAGCKVVVVEGEQYLAMGDTKSVILEKTVMVVGQEAPTITVGTRTVVQAAVVDETIL